MKIIIAIETHFTERDYKRFGIEHFKRAGYEVEVWNLWRITNSRYSSFEAFKYKEYIEFFNQKELKKKIEKLNAKETFIISWVMESFRSRIFFKALSRNRIRFGYVRLGALPQVKIGRRRIWKKLFAFHKYSLYAEFLYQKLLSSFKKRATPFLFMVAGKKVESSVPNKVKKIKCASLDFELFDSNRNDIGEEIIVFLDEFEPFHPDFKRLKMRTLSPFPYFDELNRFFDFVEQKYGIPVVVAAHPRSDENYADYFRGRDVIKNKTVELIKNAKLVLAHTSTAIQMGVLYKKPVAIIRTDEMEYTAKKDQLRAYSENPNLNFKIINISKNNYENEDLLEYDVDTYDYYVEQYIRVKEAPGQSPWLTLIDFLKENFV